MTYNQIIQRFEWWADGHPMLYHFTHGEFEISDLNRETAYPAIHVQPLSVRYGVQVRTYRFEVYIFELYRENGNEANEVREDLSDTLQIFEDLIAELRNGFDAFDRKEFLPVFPIEPTPFIQEHNGVLTGVQATMEIETSFFADACDSPVNPANPPSQLCPVGTITVNGVEFGTVASGGTLAGLVQYVNGTPVGSLVGEIWTIPNPAACDDVTITVNSEAYSTVASGGSDDIPVVNSAATPIGTVTPGGNVTIPDLNITVNGSAYGSTPATVDFDVDVVDSSRAPTGSLNAFGEWQIPACPPAALLSAELMKTGVTKFDRIGGDGDLQKGRLVDFLTIGYTNPFGNTKRFTGVTGGYQNADLSYSDASGSATTSVLAFPYDLVLDWSTYDGTTVQMYSRLLRTAMTWNSAIDTALTFTAGPYSGFWLPNIVEALSIFWWAAPTNYGNRYSYPPFSLASVSVWVSTEPDFSSGNGVYLPASTTLPVFTSAKTTNIQSLVTRKATVTGTVIT